MRKTTNASDDISHLSWLLSLFISEDQATGEGGMFTDKIELKDFDKMDPEYKELLGRVLTIQACRRKTQK